MTSTRIAIIDYGMGNLHSVASALHKVAPEASVVITSSTDEIEQADRVILPGVGAIRDCMAEIRRLNFDRCVMKVIDSGKPMLAICVGLQALMNSSEENSGVECLGFFDGEVKFFSGAEAFSQKSLEGEKLKVPHMGWNQVKQKQKHPMWQGIDDEARFYFVHSYYVETNDLEAAAGESEYGLPFVSAMAKANVFATQFHPEKSHDNGLQLLKNFVNWQP